MKSATAKTVFVILLVVLLLLAAVSGFVWWKTSHAQDALAAQRQAADEVKTLQAAVGPSGVTGTRKDQLESDLDEQLEALNTSAVEDAQPDSTRSATDVQSLAEQISRSSQRIYHLASNPSLSADESATLTSMSVGQWATAQSLDGKLGEVVAPSSASGRSLEDLTGLGQNASLEAKGLCPAMSDSDTDQASAGASSQKAGDDSDARDSDELTKVLTGLYKATWTESYVQARQDVDHVPSETSARVDVAAEAHGSQLQQLRSGLDKTCSTIPQPKPAYDVPDDISTDPWKVVSAQADNLSSESMALIRAQDPGDGDARGSGSWTAWGARSLALNTAVAAQADGDVPALPGIS